MKEYSRELKKWVPPDEAEKNRKLSKRKTCRGGKEHDFVLVLPNYVSKVGGFASAEEVKEYYDSIEKVADFAKKESERLVKLGIIEKYSSFRSRHKRFLCSVCGKQEYEYSRD